MDARKIGAFTGAAGFLALAWAGLYYMLYVHTPQPWTAHCPPSPFDWTHDQDRLVDLGGCRYAEGIVQSVDTSQESDDGGHGDGDHRFVLLLGPSYRMLGNGMPTLYCEIVPAYQTSPWSLATPNVDDHVAVVGSWVIDTAHNNQAEFHPVSWISVR